MERIYDEIRRLKELEKDYRIIRTMRSYMSYYNVRMKSLSDNLNVSKSTLSKIMNEKKDQVSNEIWKDVIYKLLDKIDLQKFQKDSSDFDTISLETKDKIEHLERRIEELKQLRMKYLLNG